MTERNVFKVQILDREFQLACEPGTEAELERAAVYLDQKMREIRLSGRVIGQERIAVMAALNIAHELLQQKNPNSDVMTHSVEDRVQNLRHKIDSVLNKPAVQTTRELQEETTN